MGRVTVIRIRQAMLVAMAAVGLGAAMIAAPVVAAEPAASAPAPRLYPKVSHVAWVVPNLDKALADADAQLGTGPGNLVFRRVLTVDRGTYKGRPARFSAEFALVELGNTQFEFIQPLTGVSPYSDALKGRTGAVLHHIAYYVPSLPDRIAAARKANPQARVVLDGYLKGMDAHYVYMSGVLPDALVEFIPAQ